MAKYIVDVPDAAVEFMDGEMIFSIEPKIRDLEGMHYVVRIAKEDVTSYTEPDRKAIEDEVWELADYMCRMGVQERDLCFGFQSTTEVTANLSYQEAKSKFEAWLKQKDEIRVGDEVEYECNGRVRFVVLGIVGRTAHGFKYPCDCYDAGEYCDIDELTKTGRHFDEVEELIKKMRGEKDED